MSAPSCVLIAIGGGKGGVGKSMIAANLAVAMAQGGRQTVLVDGDLGSPNLHSLLGIDKVHKTVESLLNKEVDQLDDVKTPTAVPNLSLVAGSAAAVGSANIPHLQKQKLLRHIAQLQADAVIVDVGAGTSFNTLDLFNVADVRVIVTTPQLTALQNAYAFAKSATYRELRSLAQGKEQLELLEDPRLSKDGAKLTQLVAHVRAKQPFFAAALREALDARRLFVVGNQVLEEKDANVFHAFVRMVKDFLSVDCEVLGQLRSSRRAHDSVNRRRPLLVDEASTDFALTFRRMADRVLNLNVAQMREARHRAEERAAEGHTEQPPAPLPADLEVYSRTSKRREPGAMAMLDGQTVIVQDVTQDGALVTSDHKLEIGARHVLVMSDGKTMSVEIRSAKEGGVYGAMFVERARKAAGQ
ncbi:MAG: P-loop NTPase [Myxococcaceae bacterium]|nr:P-loop NTPase [Myxococcaceae bacterium]